MTYPTREEIVSAYVYVMCPEEKEDLLWHYLMFDEEGVTTKEMEQKILRTTCEDALDEGMTNNQLRVKKLRAGNIE